MTEDAKFGYLAVRESSESNRSSSIIAHLIDIDRPLQAVIWNVKARAWEFDPRAAAAFLYDDKNFEERFRVERTEADRIAREDLQTALPSEMDLVQICAAGLAARRIEEDFDPEYADDEDEWDAEDDEEPQSRLT